MATKHPLTKQQILIKLTDACSKAEYCLEDMRRRMRRWEVEESLQQEALDYLVKERYIDEHRYASMFIRNKIQYNGWGKRKVQQALYAKRIPREIYQPLLDEVPDEDYELKLLPLLRNKLKSVKANSDYERNGKLIRFAMQRGFTYDQIERCLRML